MRNLTTPVAPTTPVLLPGMSNVAVREFSYVPLVNRAPKHVLLIEDDQEMAMLLKEKLSQQNPFTILTIASDPYEAMNIMMDRTFDYIIADWNLPNMNAKHIFDLVEKNFGVDPTVDPEWEAHKVKVITLSASDQRECKMRSTEYFDYLGHVFKRQSLDKILQDLRNFIHMPAIAS